jgi:lipopolysaccharide transport system ATP-binding protein
MSSKDIAIRVSNLGKCYEIYNNPRDRLKQFVIPQLKRLIRQPSKQYFREFWALRDVSFELRKGETLGIIGRNGSGKSTLLQLICGTLNATTGSIQTNGRIAALLELGSGFNPEFTGRENVYMSAALLGLKKDEIDKRFDDIASFADIGEFIEQPTKTYSSGMIVRLAFAVNIVSDPEIMIVDEALAVGDINFQAKCITALTRIQQRGVTVLFVSHDIGAIKSLCSRGIYLEQGVIKTIGKAGVVAEQYEHVMREEINANNAKYSVSQSFNVPSDDSISPAISDRDKETFKTSEEFDKRVELFRYGTGEARITYAELLDENGNNIISADFDQLVQIKIYFECAPDNNISPNYYILDDKKNFIVGAGPKTLGLQLITPANKRRNIVTYRTRLPLQEGIYSIQLQLTKTIVPDETAEFLDVIDDAIVFRVARRPGGRIWAKVFLPNTMEVECL